MSPLMLRQLWFLVERTQSTTLLNLDDTSLVQLLIKQLRTQRSLNHEEAAICTSYIHSRLPLIRDLARSRNLVHS
jgi:hypothetical protein